MNHAKENNLLLYVCVLSRLECSFVQLRAHSKSKVWTCRVQIMAQETLIVIAFVLYCDHLFVLNRIQIICS